jgi:ubiquinone/menaquinone biosynthesis C-methylase UbiE
MALANSGINRFTADLMDVQPDDRVLEIGFGPGRLIERLAAQATAGLVAGVDPSDVMLAQATSRNRAAIEAGRVRLEEGTVSALPFADGSFTKVCSVNTIYFWPEPESDLCEVRRVLVPGGRCYLTFRVTHRQGRRPTVRLLRGEGEDVPVAQIAAAMRAAGFTRIRSKIRRFTFVTAMCLVGETRADEAGR